VRLRPVCKHSASAVHCVLQCVAVRCSVLQCVAVCCTCSDERRRDLRQCIRHALRQCTHTTIAHINSPINTHTHTQSLSHKHTFSLSQTHTHTHTSAGHAASTDIINALRLYALRLGDAAGRTYVYVHALHVYVRDDCEREGATHRW